MSWRVDDFAFASPMCDFDLVFANTKIVALAYDSSCRQASLPPNELRRNRNVEELSRLNTCPLMLNMFTRVIFKVVSTKKAAYS